MQGIIIVDSPMTGEENMLVDDSLLATATPDSPIVLRLYRWSQPTLSIGHFQKIEDRESDALLRDVNWVKRKTGGGAILHDHEITYSVVIPDRGDKFLKGHSEILYRSVHESIVSMLRSHGYDASLSESCGCKNQGAKMTEPFLCFLRRSPVDIVLGESKILGSAQRRTSTGLLQHGSLLFRRSTFTPELLGLLDFDLGTTSKDWFESWSPRFQASLTRGLDSVFRCNWSETIGKSDGKVLRSDDEKMRSG